MPFCFTLCLCVCVWVRCVCVYVSVLAFYLLSIGGLVRAIDSTISWGMTTLTAIPLPLPPQSHHPQKKAISAPSQDSPAFSANFMQILEIIYSDVHSLLPFSIVCSAVRFVYVPLNNLSFWILISVRFEKVRTNGNRNGNGVVHILFLSALVLCVCCIPTVIPMKFIRNLLIFEIFARDSRVILI